MDTEVNQMLILMSQYNDFYRLKKCVHKWLNFDTQELNATKNEINNKYNNHIIKHHFLEFKETYWAEFEDKNTLILTKKYSGIKDLKYDTTHKYFQTIKYEFISWLLINHREIVEQKYNDGDRLFLEKINEITVNDKKKVVKYLEITKMLIIEKYTLLKTNIPNHPFLKKVELHLNKY